MLELAFPDLAATGYRLTSPVDPTYNCVAWATLPTHVARQLPSGLWTSKLGNAEDLEHTLDGLAGAVFGHVAAVLKRSASGA